MPETFELHPRLREDCLAVGDFPLCRLLLMNDAHYPWFILVPRRADIREIHELADADRQALLAESVTLARVLTALFRPHKLNLAALGNVVPQLHLHHVVRYRDDPAWPAPVWGRVPALPYPPGEALALTQRVAAALTAAADFRAAR